MTDSNVPCGLFPLIPLIIRQPNRSITFRPHELNLACETRWVLSPYGTLAIRNEQIIARDLQRLSFARNSREIL